MKSSLFAVITLTLALAAWSAPVALADDSTTTTTTSDSSSTTKKHHHHKHCCDKDKGAACTNSAPASQ